MYWSATGSAAAITVPVARSGPGVAAAATPMVPARTTSTTATPTRPRRPAPVTLVIVLLVPAGPTVGES